MVFTSPQWVPKLPFDPPDSVPISEFMLNEQYGRRPLAQSRPPFTCGLTGLEYSAHQVKDRVDNLAKALSKELGWKPNQGTEWDKVAGIFSVNTVRFRWCIKTMRSRLIDIHTDRHTYSLMGCEHGLLPPRRYLVHWLRAIDPPVIRSLFSCQCRIYNV